jgi:hypothetical protein
MRPNGSCSAVSTSTPASTVGSTGVIGSGFCGRTSQIGGEVRMSDAHRAAFQANAAARGMAGPAKFAALSASACVPADDASQFGPSVEIQPRLTNRNCAKI